MDKPKVTEVVTTIVNILEPLTSDERRRVIGASLTLLGDEPSIGQKEPVSNLKEDEADSSTLPSRAKLWMKQNTVSSSELQQVFHIVDGTAAVIGEVPGKSAKERVHNAYVMAGIAKFLETGSPSFDDTGARDLCKTAGCFDTTNHSKYLADKGNEFTGSKDKGWTLTSPGLKRGAALVKELTKEQQ